MMLRQGLQVFERCEMGVVQEGSKGLLTAVRSFPDILEGYYGEVGKV